LKLYKEKYKGGIKISREDLLEQPKAVNTDERQLIVSTLKEAINKEEKKTLDSFSNYLNNYSTNLQYN
jgi:hypothetical protein